MQNNEVRGRNKKIFRYPLAPHFQFALTFVSVPESQPPLWKSLSLAYNLKKLITQRSRSDGLDCVNGLKVFSMFFIIMGHRIMFYLGTPMVNSDYVETVGVFKTLHAQ